MILVLEDTLKGHYTTLVKVTLNIFDLESLKRPNGECNGKMHVLRIGSGEENLCSKFRSCSVFLLGKMREEF